MSVLLADDNKKVLVFVQKCKFSKPFLGGYRHKGTAIEYHNAGSQTTKPSLQTILSKDVVQRETQTYFTKNILQQTISDAATQMVRSCDSQMICVQSRDIFHFISQRPDVLCPAKLIKSYTLESMKQQKSITRLSLIHI